MSKLAIIKRVLVSDNIILITEKGDNSSVRRYNDKVFWKYAEERLKTLKMQHYDISKAKDSRFKS
jgi:hypothetical protein